MSAGRSGTTWVSRVLSSCGDVKFVDEPDSPANSGTAKRFIGHNPIIAPGMHGYGVGYKDIEPYASLWSNAFQEDGHQHVIAKSVATSHCVEWLVDLCKIDHVLFVKRAHLNAISSMVMFERSVNKRFDAENGIRRVAWLYAHKFNAYQRLQNDPGFHVLNYEVMTSLTVHGEQEMWGHMAKKLGLVWSPHSIRVLHHLQQPGNELRSHPWHPQYREWDHVHRSSDQIDPVVFKKRLSEEDIEIIQDELGRWGLNA